MKTKNRKWCHCVVTIYRGAPLLRPRAFIHVGATCRRL